MNEYSFIMARLTDESKIQRLRDVSMRILTSEGYAAATVDRVAAEAKVSVGYLYRHYPSKADLVKAIYDQKLRQFLRHILAALEKVWTVNEVLAATIDYLADLATNDRDAFALLFTMLHDQTAELPEARLAELKGICQRIDTLGKRTKEIDSAFDAEWVFYAFFSTPFRFFDSRLRGVFNRKKITKKDLTLLKEVCVNALSKGPVV